MKKKFFFSFFFGGGVGVGRLCTKRIIYLIEEICLNNNNIIKLKN